MIQIIDEKTLRSCLFGLTIGCPFLDSCEDCIFRKARNLAIEEKFDWVQELSYEDAARLYNEHLICFDRRE